MSEDLPPEPRSEKYDEPGKSYRIVHLRRADMDQPEVAAQWHARGYATLPPMEGHDPYQRCPICSTDEEPPEKPDCAICGQGPCPLVSAAMKHAMRRKL